MFLLAEDDGPSVEADLLGLDGVAEDGHGVLGAGVAAAPVEDAGEVVAGAEGDDAAGGTEAGGVLLGVVEALEDPADGAVAAADEDAVLLHLAEDVEADEGAAVDDVEDLEGVEELAEGADEVPALAALLAAAGLDVDEDHEGLGVLGEGLDVDVGEAEDEEGLALVRGLGELDDGLGGGLGAVEGDDEGAVLVVDGADGREGPLLGPQQADEDALVLALAEALGEVADEDRDGGAVGVLLLLEVKADEVPLAEGLAADAVDEAEELLPRLQRLLHDALVEGDADEVVAVGLGAVEAEADEGLGDELLRRRAQADLEGAEGDGDAEPAAVDADGDGVGLGVVVAEEELEAASLALLHVPERGLLLQVLLRRALVVEDGGDAVVGGGVDDVEGAEGGVADRLHAGVLGDGDGAELARLKGAVAVEDADELEVLLLLALGGSAAASGFEAGAAGHGGRGGAAGVGVGLGGEAALGGGGDVLLFAADAEELLHGELRAGDGEGGGGQDDLGEDAEVALGLDGLVAAGVGRGLAPLALHAGEALLAVAALAADGALGAGREVSLAPVVVEDGGGVVVAARPRRRLLAVRHGQVPAVPVHVVLAHLALVRLPVLAPPSAHVAELLLQPAPVLRPGVGHRVLQSPSPLPSLFLLALPYLDELHGDSGAEGEDLVPAFLVARIIAHCKTTAACAHSCCSGGGREDVPSQEYPWDRMPQTRSQQEWQ